MKYYLSPAGALYAYESDGSQDHLIADDFVVATPEQVDVISNPVPLPNDVIKQQIFALEATITLRRLREATLSDAGKPWLADVDAQIAALRATLTP